MSKPLHTVDVLKWSSVGVISFALFLGTWQIIADEQGLPYRYWARYTSMLERKMRLLFIFTPGRIIALGQLGVMFLILAANLAFDLPMWWALIAVTAVGPAIYLELERRKRVALIEDQLDNFMLSLANALKSTPSIGAAFNSVVTVIEAPMKQEVDLAIKEMKVGSTLDQALLHMASRVGSRPLDSALSSILIGRQVGGNLPKVLETTATTLREMKRLEGVIRTKTADGRMQMWVIGAFPAVVLVLFSSAWPGYFQPLTASFSGYVLTTFISLAWVSALLLARKVLAVDF
ncbi:MAG: type II secretion system F family protein [Deltaproteobacteria bacterium]|nr:type II secretion system F family protein [Deltaproteobacteria bacterium]